VVRDWWHLKDPTLASFIIDMKVLIEKELYERLDNAAKKTGKPDKIEMLRTIASNKQKE